MGNRVGGGNILRCWMATIVLLGIILAPVFAAEEEIDADRVRKIGKDSQVMPVKEWNKKYKGRKVRGEGKVFSRGYFPHEDYSMVTLVLERLTDGKNYRVVFVKLCEEGRDLSEKVEPGDIITYEGIIDSADVERGRIEKFEGEYIFYALFVDITKVGGKTSLP